LIRVAQEDAAVITLFFKKFMNISHENPGNWNEFFPSDFEDFSEVHRFHRHID